MNYMDYTAYKNTCDFCEGRRYHTCTGYDCCEAVKKEEAYKEKFQKNFALCVEGNDMTERNKNMSNQNSEDNMEYLEDYNEDKEVQNGGWPLSWPVCWNQFVDDEC